MANALTNANTRTVFKLSSFLQKGRKNAAISNPSGVAGVMQKNKFREIYKLWNIQQLKTCL